MNTDQHNDHSVAHHDDPGGKVVFGFWVYLMTDAIMFAALFATYVVLHNNTYGGPGIQQIATLPYTLVQTVVLLLSTFTFGLSRVAGLKQQRNAILFWFLVTFILGLIFLGFEGHEFSTLITSGNSWQRSAFLSAFFTLVGLHGLHVVAGLIWMIIVSIQLLYKGLTPAMATRLTCLGLFWMYLNIIWVFIVTIVYLMGAI